MVGELEGEWSVRWWMSERHVDRGSARADCLGCWVEGGWGYCWDEGGRLVVTAASTYLSPQIRPFGGAEQRTAG